MALVMLFNSAVTTLANGSQTLQHGKDLALNQQVFKPYLEGMRMRAKDLLGADQASANDRLWHGIAEGLQEFHSKRPALCGEDLHQTN